MARRLGHAGNVVALKEDAQLDLANLKRLLQRVQKTIHQQPNFVRSAMNSFVIAMGTYVEALGDVAVDAARKIGQVTVDMGDTACQVPDALERIQKVRKGGTIGKKRKTVKC